MKKYISEDDHNISHSQYDRIRSVKASNKSFLAYLLHSLTFRLLYFVLLSFSTSFDGWHVIYNKHTVIRSA